LISIGIIIAGLICGVVFYSVAPGNFPIGKIISIEKNMTVSQTATKLKESGIIRSALFYKIYVILLHDGKGVRAGDYLFDQPQSILRIAYRTSYGIQGLEKLKVMITEGASSKDISRILAKNIPNFDAKNFLDLAKKEEGYLFPDTYYFNPNVAPREIVDEMKGVFKRKTATIQTEIMISGRQIDDIVKMASIVEKEANNDNDRQIIAGILWKRIDAGMPLQVDPPFYYFLNKISSQLTLDDLKVESPYNLYLHKGLPPTPIDNPGMNAILATIQPKKSEYWFYLSDSKGNMHYATTYDGHLANKAKYL
ncbi:MAG: endolytic transglycosylase MltG, partial [Patescibacteria group bacterium]